VTDTLRDRLEQGLSRTIQPHVAKFANSLGRESGALAVLFYGSNLRTGSLEGVLDYYVLMPGKAERGIWPRVSYRELNLDGEFLRAKIATMSLEKFAQAAAGTLLDTTIWARFVQPCALAWSSDAAATNAVIAAIASASTTAARLAVALGPNEGMEEEFWMALFEATYRAEFRIEKVSRAQSIIEMNADHFRGLLPLALVAAEIPFERSGQAIAPKMEKSKKARIKRWWSRRRRVGKLLNMLRLVRAAATFDGAARYAAWKIERHSGVHVKLTPWRERHPILAAPAVLWSVWRERKKTGSQDSYM